MNKKLNNFQLHDFKQWHYNLYYNQLTLIPNAFVNESVNNDKKNQFREQIKFFLNSLSDLSKNIRYVEEYLWIKETINFWEGYLESIFYEVVDFNIDKSKSLINQSEDPVYYKALEKIIEKLALEKISLIIFNDFSNYQIKIFAKYIDIKHKKIIEIHDFNKKIIVASLNDYSESKEVITKLKQECRKYFNKNIDKPIIFLYDYASERYNESERKRKEKNPETRLDLEENIHELLRDFEEFFWLRDIPVAYFISKENARDWILENIKAKKWYTISRQFELDSNNSNDLQEIDNCINESESKLPLKLSRQARDNMQKNTAKIS